jgi:phospholysine phosphohistidine inorganic pyrophosphate phosphatase
MSLNNQPVLGVLSDITGVLYESSTVGDGTAITGSVEAVARLLAAGIPVRFVTNESQGTRERLTAKLHRLGFSMPESSILPPALAMVGILTRESLRPHLLVHERVLPEFAGISTEDPNCVVLGDAVDAFSYENMNTAFRILASNPDCKLFSLGKGKYYKEDGELTLDVGPYTAALEFATDKSAIVCGKPSATFFEAAVEQLGVDKEHVVMIGDDIVSDVGGAQEAGIRGVLVRSGKYRPSDENHPKVKPDKIVDNLKELVDIILGSQ